jgi:DNA-directed RNA polymerase subunit RPC12/RpoP
MTDRTAAEAPVLGYICAACGAPAECDLVDLDTGATLTCDRCGGKTVVVLQSIEQYVADHSGMMHQGCIVCGRHTMLSSICEICYEDRCA